MASLPMVASGGGGDERLCYVEYVGKDAVEIPVINNMTQGSSFSSYLSYDSTTKKFTVLQDFVAFIMPWVQVYKSGSPNKGSGAFYINNSSVATYSTSSSSLGAVGGAKLVISLKANDTFWNYTTSTSGWPQQMLKVYKTTLSDGAVDFSDEDA